MQMSGLIESGPWSHSVLLRQQPESVGTSYFSS